MPRSHVKPLIASTREITLTAFESQRERRLGLPTIVPALITEIGAEITPTGRFTLNLESGIREERIFTRELRDDLVLPVSGRRPFRLFGSGFLILGGDTLFIWLSDLSGASNTVRIFVRGIYLKSGPKGEPIAPEGIDLNLQHDSYWSDILTISANDTAEAGAQVRSEGFTARSITIAATGNLDLFLRSQKRNDVVWATGLRLRSIVGTGDVTAARSFFIDPGFYFPQDDTIEFFVTNRTGSTNTVAIGVHGESRLRHVL